VDEISSDICFLSALYMNNPLPKVTFLIVKKRHNTRFFVQDPNTGNMNNVQPGTVVDTDIVHPEGFDFYLNSHAAIQGRFHFRK
jgi:eukaryotic translation initiation factor 2C